MGKFAEQDRRAIERLGQAMAEAKMAFDALADAKAELEDEEPTEILGA